jgi:hypothetical protein
MWVCAGNGRASGDVRDVRRGRLTCGRSFFGLFGRRKLAARIALGQNLDGEVRAVALAQTAADAIRGFDDRVVRQDEAVLGADLDADVAALAPLVDPPDVDEVNDRRRAVNASFGGVWSSRGWVSQRRGDILRGDAGR